MAAVPLGEGQGGELGFVLIADDQGDFGHLAEFGGGALGVAAGGNHDGVRVGAAGGAEGLAGFGVGGGGYGAGVDDDDVGSGVVVHGAAAGLGELAGQGGAVGLVQLAAVGGDGNGSGHKLPPPPPSGWARVGGRVGGGGGVGGRVAGGESAAGMRARRR